MNVVTKVRSLFRRGGLVAFGSVLLLWAPSMAIASTSTMNRPMAVVQADLGRLLSCQWQGTEKLAVCPVAQTKGTVNLTRNPTANTVETVEMNVLVAGHPPNPDDEKSSRRTVVSIVRYLLPSWKKGPEWIINALDAATHVRGRKIIKMGETTVLVQWLQPADIADTFATVVITKKASLDDWSLGEGDTAR